MGRLVRRLRKARPPDQHVSELLVQEYVSLRNESLSAKQNQQTILQWAIATAGIVVAASIAVGGALEEVDALGRFSLNFASAVLVGGLMPVVVSCAFGNWLGELHRMERAGQFLREREAAWSGGAARSGDPSDPEYALVLLWESLLVNDSISERFSKNRLGSAASVGLFLVLAMFSLAAGVIIVVGPGGTLANLPEAFDPVVVTACTWVWVGIYLIANAVFFYKPVKKFAAETTQKTTGTDAQSKVQVARG
ncbi:MAG: hypothetical protein ABS61_13745 [Microbacterium sp. SCN 70-18]|nr:MAG: hypothetical protein ABS61_13745 [Microbacterium sp. SCN 70-18]